MAMTGTGMLGHAQLRDAGVFGLNTEAALSVPDPRWLTEATNLVFDDSGRLTCRKGLTELTSTGAHSDDVEAIFEFIQDASNSEIVSAAGAKLYTGTTTLTDITGALTPGGNDWQFVNFNGKVIGVQQGETPIAYTGTGTFAAITAASGTIPTGNAVLSAWGRLWVVDADKTTIKMSATLDETHWATGAASLDTLLVWPDGIDQISALAEWQNQLLIFGSRSILVYTGAEDPAGAGFVLTDIIRRGTKWRDSVVGVGRDILFLSDDGLRSVSRGLASQSMPLAELSTQVATKLIGHELAASMVQAAYSPSDRAYLLRLKLTGGNRYWYFDLSQRLEDGDLRAIEWNGIDYTAIAVASDEVVYLGGSGKVASHSGYQDAGASYLATFLTAGTLFDTPREKLLKNARMQISGTNPVTVRFRYRLDLQGDGYTVQLPSALQASGSEWNVAEWGEAEWSGLVEAVSTVAAPLTHGGHIVQVGAQATVDGSVVSFSNIEIIFKLARIAA